MSRRSILLDTNLLVLLVVGQVSGSAVATHKRTRAYTREDYLLLVDYLSNAQKIVVTPNVITEASNLLGQADDRMREKSRHVLKQLLANVIETYIPSKAVSQITQYSRLGITDAAMLDRRFEDHELLTTDVGLYLAASGLGRQVINFIHYIEANSPD